ncbi:MAG: hypothetical protein RRZ64_00345 [Rikenellaceae bacterium]
MTNENFTWETTFETAKDLMIHTMTDRVKVVANIKTGTVKVFRDGDVLETIEDPLIIEYEKFLLRIAKSANELDKLTPKES